MLAVTEQNFHDAGTPPCSTTLACSEHRHTAGFTSLKGNVLDKTTSPFSEKEL